MNDYATYDEWVASLPMPSTSTPNEYDRAGALEFGFNPDALGWQASKGAFIIYAHGVPVLVSFSQRRSGGYKAAVHGLHHEIYTREELRDAIEAYVAKVEREARPRAIRIEANGPLMFKERVLPLVEEGYTISHCYVVQRDGMPREIFILTLG